MVPLIVSASRSELYIGCVDHGMIIIESILDNVMVLIVEFGTIPKMPYYCM